MINESAQYYYPIYLSVFLSFDKAIQNSYAGKILLKKIIGASKLKEGNVFPIVQVKDTIGKGYLLNPINKKTKYTLIDFWFSKCIPCLSLFEEYKPIYEASCRKIFEIIAISVDEGDRIIDWKRILRERKFPWKNYLLNNNEFCAKYNIATFPTNFLVNENGVIIKKNITVKELKKLIGIE